MSGRYCDSQWESVLLLLLPLLLPRQQPRVIGRFVRRCRCRCCPLTGKGSAASFPGVRSYSDLLDFAIRDPERFWGALARERLHWTKPFERVQDSDFGKGSTSWFLGGQLNVSVNCLDRHVKDSPNRVALIWERDEPGTELRITYRELLETTCRIANTLKRHGVQKGDTVAIYMPVSPVAVAAMLACARIGAIHSVIFAGFSSQALSTRINDAQCKTIITCNQSVRGGRIIELKKTVDEAVKMCPTVKRVFVEQRTENKVQMNDIDIPLEEEMKKEEAVCDPEPMDSEDMLFMLYTSGSTGQPKGLVHTQAGYLLYTSITHKYVFEYQQGDVFGCVADIGWITGHSYVVYGPLCNGGTSVLFESTPVYPHPGRYWETVERLRINQFYGAPTAIRLLLKYGDSWVTKYDRSSLKVLGTVGEPINYDAWQWYWKVVGGERCTLIDTWWQTGENHCDIELEKLGLFSLRLRPDGSEATPNQSTTQLAPGMLRSVIHIFVYLFSGYYFTGDGAYRSKDGYYQITGRMDDVINISGHRLGTAEIESALDEHPDVPETAVVGCPHHIKGEGAFAFVVLKDTISKTEPAIVEDLKSIVAAKIAKYAVPDQILIVKRLPKTRSGKIMRRVLKKIVTDHLTNQEDLSSMGDLSTLDDPMVIKEIVEAYKIFKEH
uniref:Propionate--CoA ligase n=1 Tax=Callorhinchus milii TaxID=7868 RepID=A0A4W3H2V6_CALMI